METKTKNVLFALAIIAGILLIYFSWLNSEYIFAQHSGDRNIAIGCYKKSSKGDYNCEIDSADTGIDFQKTTIQVIDAQGTIIVQWNAAITYVNGTIQNDSAKSPVFKSAIIDNGDQKFGIDDYVYLMPENGKSLIGLTIKLTGGGGSGSTTIN